MANAIDYSAVPAAGTRLSWADQEYEVLSSSNFLVRGHAAGVIRWRTVCPDCKRFHDFETGLRRRNMPKRCKPCNGPQDLDALERKAYAKAAWYERLQAGKARKRERQLAQPVNLLDSRLNGSGQLEATLVLSNGDRIPLRWAPGVDLSKELAPVQAAAAMLANQHAALQFLGGGR